MNAGGKSSAVVERRGVVGAQLDVAVRAELLDAGLLWPRRRRHRSAAGRPTFGGYRGGFGLSTKTYAATPRRSPTTTTASAASSSRRLPPSGPLAVAPGAVPARAPRRGRPSRRHRSGPGRGHRVLAARRIRPVTSSRRWEAAPGSRAAYPPGPAGRRRAVVVVAVIRLVPPRPASRRVLRAVVERSCCPLRRTACGPVAGSRTGPWPGSGWGRGVAAHRVAQCTARARAVLVDGAAVELVRAGVSEARAAPQPRAGRRTSRCPRPAPRQRRQPRRRCSSAG